MAKNKVINTVLQLRDNMSGGLLKAAKNAKKSGANISDSMMNATRQVVAFKNKAVDGIKTFAKTAMGVGVAGASALTTAFLTLDGATEEYRAAQGRVNSAFSAAKLSAQDADAAFRGFYRILGDTDTAAEASQLLAQLTQNGEDVSSWLHIAAGVAGRFTDSIPTEGLIEAMNETAKVGQVTGVFADALNWAGASEEKFNKQLEACSSESERNRLIMDTMLGLYNDSAHAFYANNDAMMDSREHSLDLQKSLSKLGNASVKAKNGILEMLGAQEGGGFRAGSMLDWATQKAEAFGAWMQTADFSAFAVKVDQGFTVVLDKAADAISWCKQNGDTLILGLKLLGGAFVAVKIVTFTSNVISAGQTIVGFISTLAAMRTATSAQAGVTTTATLAQHGLNAALRANPIGAVITLVTALVAVGIELYQNWDTVKKYGEKLKNFFVGGFFSAINKVKGAFDSVKSAVGGLIDKVKDFLGMDTNKEVKVTTKYDDSHGHNALGTSYWRGGPTAVHERGGEIIDLPNGTRIIPHDVSEKMAGGRNINLYVIVQGNVIGNRQYADELGEIVVGKVLRAIDNV